MSRRTSKKKNNNLIAIIVIMLVFLVALVGIIATSFSKPAETEWTSGIEDGANAPVAEKQGENGWYFMYSDEHGTDGKSDVTKLKELVWGTSGSCWFFYGVDGMWLPEEYAAKGYDASENACWWLADTEGHFNLGSKTAYTGAIAWEAPYDGKYTINFEYEAGSNSYDFEGETYYLSEDDGGDGLYLSLIVGENNLERAYCKLVTEKDPELTTGTIEKTVELKEGERLYIGIDPGKSANGDTLNYSMKITLEDAQMKFSLNKSMLIWIGALLAIMIGFIYSFVNKRQD